MTSFPSINFRSFRFRVALIATSISIGIAVTSFTIFLINAEKIAYKQFYHANNLLATIQAESISTPLRNLDYEQVEQSLKALTVAPELEGAIVYDENSVVVAKFLRVANDDDGNGVDDVRFDKTIFHDNNGEKEKIGELRIYASTKELENKFQLKFYQTIFILLLITILTAFFMLSAAKYISRPIDLVSDAMRKYAAGDKEVHLPQINTQDEIGNLARTFIEMQKSLNSLQENLETEVVKRTKDFEKEKEKAEKANRIKTEFLANMSHEIRTPMNGVLGMVQLLEKTKLDNKQKEFLLIIRSSADSLLQIINDILDISKMEANKLELEKILFSPAQIFKEVDNMFKFEINDKNLFMKMELDKSIEEFTLGDPGRIKQILVNLISNSIKFTETGGITIKSSYIDKQLNVQVSDTGGGIAGDKLEQIFDKFMQADSSVTRKFGGTGLGLAITTELVKMMNGKISLESKVGEGSTFSFYLKLGN